MKDTKPLYEDIQENKQWFEKAKKDAAAEAKELGERQAEELERLQKHNEPSPELLADLQNVVEQAKATDMHPEQEKSIDIWQDYVKGKDKAEPSQDEGSDKKKGMMIFKKKSSS